MSWAPRTRTWKLSVQSRAGLPVPLPPTVSRHSVSSRTACFTRAGPQPCLAACVSPARLERALPAASGRASCHWLRGHGADTRGRTGPSAVRRRSREPRASAWLPGLGSNQRGQTSEACWGRRRPTRNRVRGAGLEPANDEVWARRLSRLALPARAPPPDRTEIAQGKSLVLWPVKLAALGADSGNRTRVTRLEAWHLSHSATSA
jgi:hypothetical protein